MQLQPRDRSDYRSRPSPRGEAVKADARAFNLAALAGSLAIADYGIAGHPDRLHLDWLELAGEVGPDHTVNLLAPMLGPGCFIGVDREPAVIKRAKAFNLPHTTWLRGDLRAMLDNQPELFEHVGVLNYDSLAGWWGESIVQEVSPLLGFAATQQRRHLEFVLIVNASTRNKPRDLILRQVQRVFRPLLSPLDRVVEDRDVLFYRARGGHEHMCNVRVRLGLP